MKLKPEIVKGTSCGEGVMDSYVYSVFCQIIINGLVYVKSSK